MGKCKICDTETNVIFNCNFKAVNICESCASSITIQQVQDQAKNISFQPHVSESFSIAVHKKNPKPNAPSYRIKTMEQLFEILTEGNYKRFLKDFKHMVELTMMTRKLTEATAEAMGLTPEQVKQKTEEIIWIDD